MTGLPHVDKYDNGVMVVRFGAVPRSDYELLQAWGEGNADAGDELVQRYVPVVHRFFRGKVEREIEDLAQRTFLACVEGRERFRADAAFKTYLLAIARRQLMMYLRKRIRGERAMKLNELSMEEVAGSPSQFVGMREELKLLHIVLRRIPVDLQITVELFYWEELPIADVATVLEIPPGTVKSRLSRAREVLKAKILETDASEHLQRTTVQNLEDWARQLRAAFDRS